MTTFIQYQGAIYRVANQRLPHRKMTTQEKQRFKKWLRPKGIKKQLLKFTNPVWRAISGKIHKGCWESTFTYKLMGGGVTSGKTTNWTRCVSFDKKVKPTIKKNPEKSLGYEVIKQEEKEEKKEVPKPTPKPKPKTKTKPVLKPKLKVKQRMTYQAPRRLIVKNR